MKPVPANQPALQSDQGAILVQAALILLALLAFSAFAVDYGVLWASRRQAQNAADAAALAGAVAFAFDSQDTSTSGAAYESAQRVAQLHRVWGQTPSSIVAVGAGACPAGVSGVCVRVEVYRNAAHGNALPTFFGTLVNINSQDVQATATAQAAVANATDCLKPWAVVDKWNEHWPTPVVPWSQASDFNKYVRNGGSAGQIDPSITTPDEYVAPTPTSVGSGFHPYDYTPDRTYSPEYGIRLNLTVGSRNDYQYTAGWFAAMDFANSSGAHDYGNNIKSCVGLTYAIGQELEMTTETGQMTGQTSQAVGGAGVTNQDPDSLYNQDPGAYWDPDLNDHHGGVANSAFPVSPRIVPVPLVNPDELNLWNSGGKSTVTISNIMGFFVEGYDKNTKSITGYLCALPGMKLGTVNPISAPSGFLQAILLIR